MERAKVYNTILEIAQETYPNTMKLEDIYKELNKRGCTTQKGKKYKPTNKRATVVKEAWKYMAQNCSDSEAAKIASAFINNKGEYLYEHGK